MSTCTPDPRLIEARRIAKAHDMVMIEKPLADGKTSYIVFRKLPDGRTTFLGKRGTPQGIRAYVARLARYH